MDAKAKLIEALAAAGIAEQQPRPQPATIEDVRHLLMAYEGGRNFEVGDLVTLAPHAVKKFTTPQAGEHVVVTQVFAPKHDLTNKDNPVGGSPVDMAIAMKLVVPPCECGDSNCPQKDGNERLVEYLHDSRDFHLVQSRRSRLN